MYIYNSGENAKIIFELFKNYYQTTFNMLSRKDNAVQKHTKWLKIQIIQVQQYITKEEIKILVTKFPST